MRLSVLCFLLVAISDGAGVGPSGMFAPRPPAYVCWTDHT